jgi:hypothetical protein
LSSWEKNLEKEIQTLEISVRTLKPNNLSFVIKLPGCGGYNEHIPIFLCFVNLGCGNGHAHADFNY